MLVYVKKFWLKFVIVTVLLFITQTLIVYASIINANILNALVARDLARFGKQVLLLLLIWWLVAGLQYGSSIYEQHLIQNLDIAIRANITQTLTDETYANYNRHDISVYESWLNNDQQLINQQGFESLFTVIEGTAGAILALATLAYLHWILAVVALVLTLIIIVSPRLLDHQLANVSVKLTHENEHFVAATHDALHAFNLLYAFQSLPLLKTKVHQASVKLKQANVERTTVQTQIMIIGFLGNIVSQVILMGVTGWLALQRLVSIGTISAVGSLAGNVFNTLGNMSNTLGLIRGTKPIFQKYETEQQFIAPHVTNDGTHFSECSGALHPILATTHLSFQFGGQSIFTEIFQSFYAGQKYLITGESGSGKSTFLKLLAGYLQPTHGNVALEGQNLSTLSLETINGTVLYLDQRPYLINGTVRENLLLNQMFDESRLIRVLQTVFLATTSDDATKLLSQAVGPDGSNLSGGQRQRLALARGLLRNPKILLLDEGTSAIDEPNAIRIERQLLTNSELTLIMISHTVHEQVRPLFDHTINFDALIKHKDSINLNH